MPDEFAPPAETDKGKGNEKAEDNAAQRLSREATLAPSTVWNTSNTMLAQSSLMSERDTLGTSNVLDDWAESSRAARLAMVTVEGAAYTVPGIAKGVMHDLSHPGEFATKAGGAFSLGVGLRTLLPKAGAGRAVAAGIFTYYLARDAAIPVMGAYSDVWDADNHMKVKIAAEKAGDGLGMFAWDAYVGMKIAGAGERFTEKALRSTMGETRFNAFERTKGDFFGSDQYFLGRHLNNLTRGVDKTTDRMSELLKGKDSSKPELPLEEKIQRIKEAEHHHAATRDLMEFHRTGAKSADGKPMGLSRTVDLLLAGKDPRTVKVEVPEVLGGKPQGAASTGIIEVPGFKVDLTTARVLEADVLARGVDNAKFRWHGDKGVTVEYFGTDGKMISRVRSNEYDATSPSKNHTWDVEFFHDGLSIGKSKWDGSMTVNPSQGRFSFDSAGQARSPRGPNSEYGKFLEAAETKGPAGRKEGEQPAAKDATKDGAKEPAATKDPIAEKIDAELTTENLTLLAKMNKQDMDRWKDPELVDAVEGAVGPVHAALNPNHRPLDPGYREWRDQMVGLANQVRDRQDAGQVWPLFQRGRDAAVQHMSAELGPTGALTHELNLFSHEIHTGLKHGMERAGVPAKEVLNAKNPPLNLVGHTESGPHTIPEIQGVWDVDLVHYPRNMVGTRSITTSGIYGHEFGHNQYGGIMRFAESIRETVIKDAVTDALSAYGSKTGVKDLATQVIEVPGVGKMTKAEVITEILKAQANENTADIWGAAWTGPNSGASLGVLLQSLRPSGKLETRNVFGKEFMGPENPLGFEVHANDAFRPMLVAEVLRNRANGDPLLLKYAENLERYSREASREGDYVWASLDSPGKSVTIPRAELEAVIPFLVNAQMNTPLPALKGKTFGEILPDLPTHMKKMDTLADVMVEGILAGKKAQDLPFSVQDYTINQVFGAGLPATARLVGKGMSAAEANARVNEISDALRAKYHQNNPHIDPLNPSPTLGQMILNPSQIGAKLKQATGQVIGNQPRFRDFADRRADLFLGYAGMTNGRDIYSNFSPVWKPGMYNLGNDVSQPPAQGGADQANRAKGGDVQAKKPADDYVEGRSGEAREIPRPKDPFILDQRPTTIDSNELRDLSNRGRSLLERARGAQKGN